MRNSFYLLVRFLAFAFVALAAVAEADTYVNDKIILNPSPLAFSVCFGHTCDSVAQLSLSTLEWQEIQKIFSGGADSPAQERQLIGKAIARMEGLVGPLTDTSNDRGGNLSGLQAAGNQMDCIDESTNTTTYLKMLVADGLVRWHTVEDRVTRGWFIFGWPHTTAVLKDLESGDSYAVDSWFFDNGVEPAILPLALWKDGWRPQE